MWKKILGSLLRHTLTTIGGGVAATGDEAVDVIAGAAIAIVGAILSLKKAKTDADADRDR